MSDQIIVKGAREHNLKNIDVIIPRGKLVVITGLSGSGKSSLAFDTIYAEGQRRYVESLSSYARQFLGIMEKPDVDQIDGLSPAISIDQKSTSRNPRSTVATVTEIYDYLRLLFARVGVPHCSVCGKSVERQTISAIVDQVSVLTDGARLMILAPIVIDKKGAFEHISEQYMRAGFARARVDGVVYALDEFPVLDKNYKHNIEIVVDRIVNNEDNSGRLAQSVEQAFDVADGKLKILNADSNDEFAYSLMYACIDHPDVTIPELEPRTFSFNSPHGACPICTGLGSRMEVDPELVIPNGRLTIAEGAIRPFNRVTADAWYMKKMQAVADEYSFSLHVPTGELKADDLERILYGTGIQKYRVSLGGGRAFETTYEGVIPNLERRHKETESDFMRRDIERFMRERPCNTCHGRRLKPEVLAITIDGQSIMDICELSIDDALTFFDLLQLNEKESQIAKQIFKEVKARLTFMQDVGLNYLSLARSAVTLSGGEAQRIRLATQIGSGLQGVLYVLDEPSIGLHQRDNAKLISTLKHLRDLGNTVIVVEHDEETIRTADYVLDIGPGAGIHGGEVVAAGTPDNITKNEKSITGQYLRGSKKIATPKKRRLGNGQSLVIKGARENNLKNITVKIPLGQLVVVSGVSGSGKSSLINDILAKELSARLMRANEVPGRHDEIEGIKQLDKAIIIDQSPIGRTPRSNPATYTGLFTTIRELFAGVPESKLRGYSPGRFSFNVKGGRCENCAGDGIIKIEMHFLPDVYVTCEVCNGKRYNREALEIHYRGKTISDVLDMTCEQALEFFVNIPAVSRRLQTLVDVGLGYIKLGQPATTLSGGEAQRIKLASELSRRPTGRTLYILDEPTTGLHMADVDKLLHVLHALVDAGNSMIIIEHNIDVIKSADYLIDMGPEGGAKGGQIIAEGTPEQVAKINSSFTGNFLKKVL
ncbi:excinuclease ABC subunit UvrA [Candidatus Saccharibacteria bacterium]|nr:excinuclease ABC subunit UvrA [Candidatus Saccharibacteria bacterium]MBI3338367.1 excinuclease ABC subunit UvrA [Candidatus Saccharibacteria bacterium]